MAYNRITVIFFCFVGFSWSDKNPVAYVNWYTGRPNTGSRHLCAGMSSGGKWWDLPCYSRYQSICKGYVGRSFVVCGAFIVSLISSNISIDKMV